MKSNTSIDNTFIDSIYEAGVNTDYWPGVLNQLSTMSKAKGAVLIALNGEQSGWVCSSSQFGDLVKDHFAAFPDGNERTKRLMQLNRAGFVTDRDVFSSGEELEYELYADFLIPRGYGQGLATIINSPSGESMIFHAESGYEDEPFSLDTIAALNFIRPHLARASLITALIGIEKAKAVTNALEALGLPAALVRDRGRLLSANSSFERLIPSIFLDYTQRLAITDSRANKLLSTALDHIASDFSHQTVRTIPVSHENLEHNAIVHIVPLHNTARDIFPVATALIVAIKLSANDKSLSSSVIQGLYDLSPAEASVAEGIAKGLSLSEIASNRNVTVTTVRNQLKQIFLKSGTHRQTELVKLLQGLVKSSLAGGIEL